SHGNVPSIASTSTTICCADLRSMKSKNSDDMARILSLHFSHHSGRELHFGLPRTRRNSSGPNDEINLGRKLFRRRLQAAKPKFSQKTSRLQFGHFAGDSRMQSVVGPRWPVTCSRIQSNGISAAGLQYTESIEPLPGGSRRHQPWTT